MTLVLKWPYSKAMRRIGFTLLDGEGAVPIAVRATIGIATNWQFNQLSTQYVIALRGFYMDAGVSK